MGYAPPFLRSTNIRITGRKDKEFQSARGHVYTRKTAAQNCKGFLSAAQDMQEVQVGTQGHGAKRCFLVPFFA
jgi:hypothetical protein